MSDLRRASHFFLRVQTRSRFSGPILCAEEEEEGEVAAEVGEVTIRQRPRELRKVALYPSPVQRSLPSHVWHHPLRPYFPNF
ncbi:uncharacterized protein MYCFIDRAFT_174968 [Pseudocercospora fijiensis CIRAD86]|uniref:Uncharacterized protein n=1 Tax=Pseudocercospora fijiensis (strain CIRAD86) TaxID=383855 RepID=M2ZX21_PSEFD|nr:uncharacterized protein MYCFIDRAFT_174968 [Pseudocercospora fijiensis CIRAD86]EME83539.1 hypothetical protein MYCFIDRAFT_174968 [Pseudocercospora fijiensis CIRAD86]